MVIYKVSHEDYFQFTEIIATRYDYKFEYVAGDIVHLQDGEALPSWYIDYVLSNDFATYQIKIPRIEHLMSATKKHDIIIANVNFALKLQTRGKNISIYSQGAAVYIEIKETVRIPDLVAVKTNEEKRNKMHDILNPVALFEVLSKSTKKTDKMEEYKTIESVVEYVMIDQNKPYLNINRRISETKWEEEIFTSLNDQVKLESLNTNISLSEVYEGINWNEKED